MGATLAPRSAAERWGRFAVLESYTDIAPWLDRVRQEADAHTHELGFFPSGAFLQFARKGWLYVLTTGTGDQQVYAGHLLFDVRFPQAHIRQMYIHKDYRRDGCASLLLGALRDSLTSYGYISIYARVAEDLDEANSFWQRQKFYVQRTELGGSTKNRHILVRCCELESPQLFPPSNIDDENDPLGLTAPASSEIPMYLLDLNVLFDVSKPRRPRRAEAVGLLQADRMTLCRLAISDEIRAELERTALASRETDPMAGLVHTFPCVPVEGKDKTDNLLNKLAALIFPAAAAKGGLNPNERSDLRHLAAAINNDLAGLITNDQALLDAAETIEKRYRVRILHSAHFEQSDVASIQSECIDFSKRETLSLLPVDDRRANDVYGFLTKTLGISGSEVAQRWLVLGGHSRITVQVGVWVEGACIGYLTLSGAGVSGGFHARAASSPAHPRAMEAARMLLLYLIERMSECGPGMLQLEMPERQPQLRETAVLLGFSGNPRTHTLSKSILGRVVTPVNWASQRQILSTVGGPKLPLDPPSYRSADQQMEVLTPDGNRRHISLDRLESLLSPALLCLSGRPAIITPVVRAFAEPLLGHSKQRQLLPMEATSLFQERIYIGTPRALRHFRRGTLMFFYESGKNGGRSAVVALARVREAYLKGVDLFEESDLHQSVLDTKHLNEIGKSAEKAVTLFDNIFPLTNPVSLEYLKEIGCGRPNDLITTKPVTSERAARILAKGFSSGL